MDLNNKTVLITGASSGIGQATAIEFAKQKSHLILLYNQNKAGVEKTKSLASQFTSNITVIQADLTQTEHIKKAFDQIQKLDIVINNA